MLIEKTGKTKLKILGKPNWIATNSSCCVAAECTAAAADLPEVAAVAPSGGALLIGGCTRNLPTAKVGDAGPAASSRPATDQGVAWQPWLPVVGRSACTLAARCWNTMLMFMEYANNKKIKTIYEPCCDVLWHHLVVMRGMMRLKDHLWGRLRHHLVIISLTDYFLLYIFK